MPENRSRTTSRNLILAGLSRGDFGLLESHLEGVDLPVRKQLEAPNKRIDRVYFIEHGFASVVANGSGHRGIEVGLIGREGMTGLAVIMGTDRSPHETFIQAAGNGQGMAAAKLRQGMHGMALRVERLTSKIQSYSVTTAISFTDPTRCVCQRGGLPGFWAA